MNLSFALTTDAFLKGQKTVTRRIWKDSHAQQWIRAWERDPSQIHVAWNKSPRAKGVAIGHFKLAAAPYQEALGLMPDSDLLQEGGLWASKQEFIDLFGGDPTLIVWVLRFQRCPTLWIEDNRVQGYYPPWYSVKCPQCGSGLIVEPEEWIQESEIWIPSEFCTYCLRPNCSGHTYEMPYIYWVPVQQCCERWFKMELKKLIKVKNENLS